MLKLHWVNRLRIPFEPFPSEPFSWVQSQTGSVTFSQRPPALNPWGEKHEKPRTAFLDVSRHGSLLVFNLAEAQSHHHSHPVCGLRQPSLGLGGEGHFHRWHQHLHKCPHCTCVSLPACLVVKHIPNMLCGGGANVSVLPTAGKESLDQSRNLSL